MFKFLVAALLLSVTVFVTSKSVTKIPTKNLRPTGKIPVIGLGTWQSTGKELEEALENALETGYRHIDTAYLYGNEKVIGNVLKRWIDSGKIKREDLFIVTKLPPGGNRAESVEKYVNKQLKDLQLDYVDLYLIHAPIAFVDDENPIPKKDGKVQIDTKNDHIATWKALESQVDAGKLKALGLSNFNKKQIKRIMENSRIKPANLQIEVHAYHQDKPLVDYAIENDITVTAYSPLGSPGAGKFLETSGLMKKIQNIMVNPIIIDIAKKHNKTPAQILLRHGVQKGLIVIPKSTKASRIQENFDIFDIELDYKDMESLNGLDKGEEGRIADFNAVFPGIKEHPEYPF